MIVKVCGMRDAANIKTLDILGIADWMGFIFYPKSIRFVDSLPDYLPRHSKRVGVFVNADADFISEHVADYSLNLVQLHGDETPAFCKSLRQLIGDSVKIIKTIPVETADDLKTTSAFQSAVDYFLFETRSAGYGGSGNHFDWSLLSSYHGKKPFLLTGGIGPDDAEAILTIRHPQFMGIDLNSRFETDPALKDINALLHFVTTINDKR